MNTYFECNIPMEAPEYVNAEKAEKLSKLFKSIHQRMNKLNTALDITNLSGEKFSVGAQMIFERKSQSGETLIDELTAQEIAERVLFLTEGMSEPQPRMEWPNAGVIVDTAFVTTKEWEAIRINGLGGSDAAVTMGVSPYRTEQALYHDKVATPEKLVTERNGLEFIFSYGHKVEPLVIEEFCRRTGAMVIPETRMFYKKTMPFITANIDAVVIKPDGKLAVFEAKTTTFYNFEAWKEGRVPVQYVPQCRQYMGVLDDPRICGAYIGCIYGNTPSDWACSFIERDLQKEESQFEIEANFWNEYVLSQNEPEPSGIPEEDIETLRRFSGPADKSLPAINLVADDINILNEYMELKAEKKVYDDKSAALKERMQQLSLELIAELGMCTKGVLAKDIINYYEVSYSPRSKKSIDEEKLRLMFPEAYDACVSVNPESSRVFAVKEKKIKAPKMPKTMAV